MHLWTVTVIWMQNCRALMSQTHPSSPKLCVFLSVTKQEQPLLLSAPARPPWLPSTASTSCTGEIARSCNCYMEALALVGAWYTARKSITAVCELLQPHQAAFHPAPGEQSGLDQAVWKMGGRGGKRWGFQFLPDLKNGSHLSHLICVLRWMLHSGTYWI